MAEGIGFHQITVTRRRPDGETLTLLDHVTFTMPTLKRFAVIGPSGVGKTTLLRLINRLDEPDCGTITINGTDIRSIPPPELRRRVGMVFQHPRLFDTSVWENLNRPLTLAKRSPLSREAALNALERVDLSSSLLKSNSREISIGQQQRVALARALVLEPEILLLDEPTSALDQRTSETVLELLARLAQESNISMIMVSHVADHAATFGQLFLAIRAGQVQIFDIPSMATDWSFSGSKE